MHHLHHPNRLAEHQELQLRRRMRGYLGQVHERMSEVWSLGEWSLCFEIRGRFGQLPCDLRGQSLATHGQLR